MIEQLQGNWNYPTQMKFGAGAISRLANACKSLGCRSPLLVTDPGLVDLQSTKNIIEHLKDAELSSQVFSDVKSNPSGDNVNAGVQVFQQGNHDCVVALGGGSALDAGKAIALMTNQNLPLWDFEDIGSNWKKVNTDKFPPIIAIPTTAGTGSEVGRASVITDEAAECKRIIFHPLMLPTIVIADPELTSSLPPHLTAATGMDALSHNLEALCSPLYHPMAEGIACEGIRLIKENLLEAYQQGNNIEARSHMLVASSMGATAFQKGLGAIHALAHPLGALYDAHHGLLNAILMPYVLQANESEVNEKIIRLSRFINLSNQSFNGFMQWLLELRQDLNIPHSLHDIATDKDKNARIGELAKIDSSGATNPIDFSASEYQAIFEQALAGKL